MRDTVPCGILCRYAIGGADQREVLGAAGARLAEVDLRTQRARRVELAHELPYLAQGLVVLGTHRPELVLEIVHSLRALLALLKPVPFLGAQLLRAIEGAIKGAIEGAIEEQLKGAIEGARKGAINGASKGAIKRAIKGVIKGFIKQAISHLELGENNGEQIVEIDDVGRERLGGRRAERLGGPRRP